jgi:hypothetical protein
VERSVASRKSWLPVQRATLLEEKPAAEASHDHKFLIVPHRTLPPRYSLSGSARMRDKSAGHGQLAPLAPQLRHSVAMTRGLADRFGSNRKPVWRD